MLLDPWGTFLREVDGRRDPSHFSKFLSSLGRVLQIFCPLKAPFLVSVRSWSQFFFFSFVCSRAIKMRFHVLLGLEK